MTAQQWHSSEQGKSEGESGSVALLLAGIKKTYGPAGP